MSLTTGIYPDRLKYANIIPCYKKGDITEISNYRPISLLTGFSKLFEILICNRLKQHLTNNNIIAEEQFGFREGASTQKAIFTLTDYIYKAWNNKELVVGIFCDLTKAFDCVNHDLLIRKLEHYGIKGSILKLLQTYLYRRKQRIILQTQDPTTYVSWWDTSRHDVPQGSVLGPLLFNVYINDLPGTLTGLAHIILYADDTTIIVSTKDEETLNYKINLIMNHIYMWFQNNQLILNLEKTHVIKFTTPNALDYSLHLAYNGQDLNFDDDVKFLGVCLDGHLTWKQYSDNLINKLSTVTSMLRKLQPIVSRQVLRMVYFSHFQAQLNYGVTFLGFIIINEKNICGSKKSNKSLIKAES